MRHMVIDDHQAALRKLRLQMEVLRGVGTTAHRPCDRDAVDVVPRRRNYGQTCVDRSLRKAPDVGLTAEFVLLHRRDKPSVFEQGGRAIVEPATDSKYQHETFRKRSTPTRGNPVRMAQERTRVIKSRGPNGYFQAGGRRCFVDRRASGLSIAIGLRRP